LALSGRFGEGRALSALPLFSDVNLLGNCQGVVYFDAEVPDRAFDLRMPKQQLLKPRLSFLTRPPFEQAIAVVCLLLALILFLPIPLGNMLPAFVICLFSFSATPWLFEPQGTLVRCSRNRDATDHHGEAINVSASVCGHAMTRQQH
jgi:hypothetical protein